MHFSIGLCGLVVVADRAGVDVHVTIVGPVAEMNSSRSVHVRITILWMNILRSLGLAVAWGEQFGV